MIWTPRHRLPETELDRLLRAVARRWKAGIVEHSPLGTIVRSRCGFLDHAEVANLEDHLSLCSACARAALEITRDLGLMQLCRRIRRLAASYDISVEAAEDLLQASLLDLVGSGEDISDPETWLLAAVERHCRLDRVAADFRVAVIRRELQRSWPRLKRRLSSAGGSLRAIDRLLGWPEGRLRRLLRGKEAIPSAARYQYQMYYRLGYAKPEREFRRTSEAVRRCLAHDRVSRHEIDRRLGWDEGRLTRLLRSKEEGLTAELIASVLEVARTDGTSYFAPLYGSRPESVPGRIGTTPGTKLPRFPWSEVSVRRIQQLVESVRLRSPPAAPAASDTADRS